MICFRKGGGRRKTIDWKWEGESIEEVAEFKYLGYVLKRNGEDDGQIRELRKKANVIIRQVWGMGERRFRDDFEKRMIMYKYLVLGVMIYEAEVWGWKERGDLERLQRKYIK